MPACLKRGIGDGNLPLQAAISRAKDYLEGALVQDMESERFVFPSKSELNSARGERGQGPAPRSKPAPRAAAPRLQLWRCFFETSLGEEAASKARALLQRKAQRSLRELLHVAFRLKAPCDSSGGPLLAMPTVSALLGHSGSWP